MCTGRGSNQGPLGPKSDALTTAPLRHLNILYGRVIVMHVETAGSLFDMRRSRKFSRGGGGGSPSDQGGSSSIPVESS